jgi:hypothetical protein
MSVVGRYGTPDRLLMGGVRETSKPVDLDG